MNFKLKVLLLIAPVVFILDQLTKYFVVAKIQLGGEINVIPSFFKIVHYTNSGAAFGFLSTADASWRTPFFYLISIFALGAILFYLKKLDVSDKVTAVALSLVVGGIFGNGLDRVRFGHVTDFLLFFIDKYSWPAFNVADSAITIAMFLLLFSSFKKQEKNK